MTKTDPHGRNALALWRLPRRFAWEVRHPRGQCRRKLLGLGLVEVRESGETAFRLEHRAGRNLVLHVEARLTERADNVTQIAGNVHMRQDTALGLLGFTVFNLGLIISLGATLPVPFLLLMLFLPAVLWAVCLGSRRQLYKRLERAFAASRD